MNGLLTLLQRLSAACLPTLALFALTLACGSARAYAEFGYYSGAYAVPGEGGCWGADAQGVNPYGGCTPGDYPLAYSTAFVYGLRGQNNHASATADLANARLSGSSWFPGGASNGPGSAANFLDTITVLGALPAPVDIHVTLTIVSSIDGPADAGGTPVQAWLLNGGGLQASYVRALDSCYWPQQGGALCALGFGSMVGSISHTETVSDSNRSFQVASALYLGGSYLLVDATATLSITMPAGLSFSSASGVFPPAVPEPGSWAMLLAGMTVLAWRARRR